MSHPMLRNVAAKNAVQLIEADVEAGFALVDEARACWPRASRNSAHAHDTMPKRSSRTSNAAWNGWATLIPALSFPCYRTAQSNCRARNGNLTAEPHLRATPFAARVDTGFQLVSLRLRPGVHAPFEYRERERAVSEKLVMEARVYRTWIRASIGRVPAVREF